MDQRQTPTAELIARLRAKDVTLGVIGLGYVGLPVCVTVAEAGLRILGFDTDPSKVKQINQGISYFQHIPSERITAAVHGCFLTATDDFARLSEPDILLICVPTPLTAHSEPDLSFVTSTAETIARHLRRGQMIVLESTTYPGTTTEVLLPILESSGLKADVDFLLAFSPEREDPGNPEHSSAKIPKVVGADSPDAQEAVTTLYSYFAPRVVKVSSSATAEAVKLTENIFRAVNIALVNELKIIFEPMGIDIWEVIEAAKTKPFGFMPFYPGPGLGGHCVPIDPFYLTWKARQHGIGTQFIELAGRINTAMPQHVIDKLAVALDARHGKSLKASSILILGIAYKKNVQDTRESPALRIMDLLEARGADVGYHDPYVPVIPQTREHKSLAGRRSRPLLPAELGAYDALLIVTDHDCIDYKRLVENAKLVIDTRNVCRRAGIASPNVVLA